VFYKFNNITVTLPFYSLTIFSNTITLSTFINILNSNIV